MKRERISNVPADTEPIVPDPGTVEILQPGADDERSRRLDDEKAKQRRDVAREIFEKVNGRKPPL
jgi:hypothetical protein